MLKPKKERHYWQIKKELLEKMKTIDPKEFWNKLKLKHKGYLSILEKENYITISKIQWR